MELATFQDLTLPIRCVFTPGCTGAVTLHEDANATCGRCGAGSQARNSLPALLDFSESVTQEHLVATQYASSSSHAHRADRVKGKLAEAMWGGATASRSSVSLLASLLAQQKESVNVLLIGGSYNDEGIQPLLEQCKGQIIAFDLFPNSGLTFLADAHHIPLNDECIDAVVSQAVLEHVLAPSTVVEEVRRVLRPKGFVYAETPFLQAVHEGAFDFMRFSHSGHRWLFRDFEELSSGVHKGPWTALLWSLRQALEALLGNRSLATALCFPLSWLRQIDRLCRTDASLDGACELWFLGRKPATPNSVTPQGIAQYYAGAQRINPRA